MSEHKSAAANAIWTPSGASSGTLAVSNGINTANINLLGQYMTANFHVSNDGHGTTFVSDPPVVAMTDQQAEGLVNPHQA